MMANYSVCIPCSGTGQRFNNELPKQFVLIRDRPLIYHTVNAFVSCSLKMKEFKLNEIVVSCSSEFEDYIREAVVLPLIDQHNLLRITLVRGGEVRHQSIFNCLKHLADSNEVKEAADHVVLVHDAVRPLVEADLLEKLIKNALAYGASGPICNLSSTILKPDKDGFMDCALNRSEHKASEMPQSFRFNSILAAYQTASAGDIEFGTECLDLVRKYTDCRVKLVPADANSLFKVTFRKDYFSALGMIKRRISYKNWLLNDALKSNLDLIKFNSNLKSMNLNELDVNEIRFEESTLNECDVVFAFTAKRTSANERTPKSNATEALYKIDQAFSTDSSSMIHNLNTTSTYDHLLLIYLFCTEDEKRELMSNCDQSFMCRHKMTVLLSPDYNPINNPALYDKIKLICSNLKSMLGQLILV